MKLIRGKQPRPRRCMLYGPHGIGKSSWAAEAPGAGFVQTEDGLSDIDCIKTPLCTKLADVYEGLDLLQAESEIRWIVLDTIDWAQSLVWQALCQDEGYTSIESPGYGKGYTLAMERMQALLSRFDECIAAGKNVLLLAHCHVKTFSPPDGDSYDRWEPKLHKLVNPLVLEWCDDVLFVNHRNMIRKEDRGFGSTRKIAVGTGERIVYCTPRPTHEAKNRANLPDTLDFSFDAYRDALKSNLKKEMSNG